MRKRGFALSLVHPADVFHPNAAGSRRAEQALQIQPGKLQGQVHGIRPPPA